MLTCSEGRNTATKDPMELLSGEALLEFAETFRKENKLEMLRTKFKDKGTIKRDGMGLRETKFHIRG